MAKHKAILDLKYDHFPMLIRYCGKEYEIRGTQAKGLIMIKYVEVEKKDKKDD